MKIKSVILFIILSLLTTACTKTSVALKQPRKNPRVTVNKTIPEELQSYYLEYERTRKN